MTTKKTFLSDRIKSAQEKVSRQTDNVDFVTAKLGKVMERMQKKLQDVDHHPPVPFNEFVEILASEPVKVLRNVFQVFHDMVKNYIREGEDEYSDDPESIHYIKYDSEELFVKGTDHPFFADRIFANRLVNLVEALKLGAQQNKIYIFEGPHGCGKSTFLNNLLLKFEQYVNADAGKRYETVWCLNRKEIGVAGSHDANAVVDQLAKLLSCQGTNLSSKPEERFGVSKVDDEIIEVTCPSHDNPILMIPKHYRRSFFDDIFENDEFKWRLFTEKEYEWVFMDKPCTICSSLYKALLNKLEDPLKVFACIYARPIFYNRRLGEGITVFNPGDKPLRHSVLSNTILQNNINTLFKDSNQIRYLFSQYARTNNGIYALMDIKSHNVERLIELHNIISEGVHKVEDIEENVNSLFISLMNPEDKKNIVDFPSFSDRIEYINIPYVLDLNTEVAIYKNVFGRLVSENFLPKVLHNFARVIISTRLQPRSKTLLDWIVDPRKYILYCDDNLQLLKMEIYTGYIPPWLTEGDRKRLDAKRRRKIIAESVQDGNMGLSGRDSIKIFNEFYSTFAKEDKLISMTMLHTFFVKLRKDLHELIPEGFLDSLLRMYNYSLLQSVKESLYNYNEDQISRELMNYLFAINFEPDSKVICQYTGEKLEIHEGFFATIENRLLGEKVDTDSRLLFRKDTQKEYASRTLTQEIILEQKDIRETALYKELHDRYVFNLKEKVLDPFLENENFRRAIKDFDTEKFKTYDRKIKNDVTFLIKNMCRNYDYSKQGAKEVCIYVIDKDLAKQYGTS
jgi:predicted Ser/Thr protein kinase